MAEAQVKNQQKPTEKGRVLLEHRGRGAGSTLQGAFYRQGKESLGAFDNCGPTTTEAEVLASSLPCAMC